MKTVVGLVTSSREAEDVIRKLTASGFRIEDLVRVGEPRNGIRKQRGKEEIFHSIEEFFGTEEKTEIKDRYVEGVMSGAVLVSVFAEDEDVDRAAEIMISCGVADIEGWLEIQRDAEGSRQEQPPHSGLDSSMGKKFGVEEKVDAHGVVRGSVRIYDHSSIAGTSPWGETSSSTPKLSPVRGDPAEPCTVKPT